MQSLKPAAALLPTASNRLDQILRSATPGLPRRATGGEQLETALGRRSMRWPGTRPRPRPSRCSARATWRRSARRRSSASARSSTPSRAAQFSCNVTGLWVRNFASSLSEGDSYGCVAAVRARPRPQRRHLRPVLPAAEAVTRPASRPLPEGELERVPGRAMTSTAARSGSAIPARPRRWSTTRRRRPACSREAGRWGSSHERRRHRAGTSRAGGAGGGCHPLVVALLDDLRDRVRHLLRVQRGSPVRPQVHALRRGQQQRQPARRLARADRRASTSAASRASRPRDARRRSRSRSRAAGSRSTGTRRSASATGCSSRAATTWSSIRAVRRPPICTTAT